LDKPSNATLLDRIAVLEKRAADLGTNMTVLHRQQAEDRNGTIEMYREAVARVDAVRREIGLLPSGTLEELVDQCTEPQPEVRTDTWRHPAGGEIKVTYRQAGTGEAPTLPDGQILGGMVFRGDRWELVADCDTGRVSVLRNNCEQVRLPIDGVIISKVNAEAYWQLVKILDDLRFTNETAVKAVTRIIEERGRFRAAAEAAAAPAPKRPRGRPRKGVESPPARRRAPKAGRR
jgi:hypothetical protein